MHEQRLLVWSGLHFLPLFHDRDWRQSIIEVSSCRGLWIRGQGSGMTWHGPVVIVGIIHNLVSLFLLFGLGSEYTSLRAATGWGGIISRCIPELSSRFVFLWLSRWLFSLDSFSLARSRRVYDEDLLFPISSQPLAFTPRLFFQLDAVCTMTLSALILSPFPLHVRGQFTHHWTVSFWTRGCCEIRGISRRGGY